MSAYGDFDTSALGPNMWLIDEMYRQCRENPGSVDEKWREFFEDFRPRIGDGAGPEAAESAPQAKEAVVEAAREDGEAAARPADRKVAARPAQETKARAPERPQKAPSVSEGSSEAIPARKSVAPPEGAERIRFAAERVVKNMQASLEVPTAPSFRFIPAKLLEENRRLVNRYLAANRDGGKVSFTHLIGYAILRALEAVPAMKSSYLEVDGEPYVARHQTVNLGLAVDVEKEDGSRTLLVPNIRGANEMDFAQFWAAYEDVIRKVRTNKLTPDDFSGTTVTLSNPGTIGTQLSVPRLMKGQGLIVATGRIDYPTEYQGADPAALAELGVGKVFGVTSTYDHRVIQGAESGLFLAKVEDLLLGRDGFYEEVFKSLSIPYEPVRWSSDRGAMDGAGAHMEKQAHVLRLINMYRVRGHLLANLNHL